MVDVARCSDGTVSQLIVFPDTCRSNGGVAEWLAPYGACSDGSFVMMSPAADCLFGGVFMALMPADFVPPTTTVPVTTVASSSIAPSTVASAPATQVPTPSSIGVAPTYPDVSPDALAFLDLDECHVFEVDKSGAPTWFECTRMEEAIGEVATMYITEDSDVVAAWEWAQAVPGYNENVAILYSVEGGGVVYEHSGYWEMFDVAPWPDLHVLDTDCAPFPEPTPAVC